MECIHEHKTVAVHRSSAHVPFMRLGTLAPSTASSYTPMMRNEDDMLGMDEPEHNLQDLCMGRSPTRFYEPSTLQAVLSRKDSYVQAEAPVKRDLLQQFDAAAASGPAGIVARGSSGNMSGNAGSFSPATLLNKIGIDVFGNGVDITLSRKDQNALKDAKKRQAQKKAMAKSKNKANSEMDGHAMDAVEMEEGCDKFDPHDSDESLEPVSKGKGKPKAKAKAKAKATSKANPSSGGRGRGGRGRGGRGRGGRGRGGRGRGASKTCGDDGDDEDDREQDEVLETPEPRAAPPPEETPLDDLRLAKTNRKRKASDKEPAGGSKAAKVVRGLPLHLRDECKKFPSLKLSCLMVVFYCLFLLGIVSAHSRLIKHGQKHRVEPYWTTSRVAVRGRDGASVWLTWIGNMKAGILLANHAVAWFAFREGAKQRGRGGRECDRNRERERERE